MNRIMDNKYDVLKNDLLLVVTKIVHNSWCPCCGIYSTSFECSNCLTEKMAELKRLTTGGYMRADMRSTGRIKGFAWWLKNIHYFNLPKIEVLKALIKSI